MMEVAEMSAENSREERDFDPDIELVKNPRDNETLVDTFIIDTTRAQEELAGMSASLYETPCSLLA